MSFIRFIFLSLLKVIGYLAYPSQLKWLSQAPQSWQQVSLVLVLNHTSLFESVYGVTLPFSFLWALSRRLVMPAAEQTLKIPVTGFILANLAPKTIALSRKRDDSWQRFLAEIGPNDICIFMPEGEMKRRDGLNKHGKPMRVKTGVYDLLKKYESKNMVIVYSQGLHHVLAPGDKFPKVFKRLRASIEFLDVSQYLSEFADAESPAKTVAQDLQRRRDRYCV